VAEHDIHYDDTRADLASNIDARGWDAGCSQLNRTRRQRFMTFSDMPLFFKDLAGDSLWAWMSPE
jgi:hypothetical protein